jgi:hypothetical protein
MPDIFPAFVRSDLQISFALEAKAFTEPYQVK